MCEKHAFSIHDKEHAFIKIRYPIQSIVKSPLLPKFKTLNEQSHSKPQKAKEMVSNTNLGNVPEEITISRSDSSSASSLPITKSKPEPKISAAFISDLNIPDGTIIVPKKTFIKVKSISNNLETRV
jgi:hypothetical protein